MTTAADIERIAALTERLTPLADRRRGELIEADHWNLVVGALLEVARAVIAEGTSETPPHDHRDQVKAGWLDPTLRARIEQGPLADPASVARVAHLERGLDRLGLALDGVRSEVAVGREMTSKVETSDLDRKSSLTRLSRRVEGLADARDDVTELRSTLGVLRTDLDRVSALARDLEANGEPISVSALAARVEELQALRSRLTGPGGEELNATTFEVRLAELAETLVTEQELDQAFADRPGPAISDDLRADLLEASAVAARQQVETSTADLEGRLDEKLSTRLSEVETSITIGARLRVDEAVEGLRTSLSGELATTIVKGDATVQAAFEAALADAQRSLLGEIEARSEALTADLARTVDERIAAGIGDLSAELAASLEALRAQVVPLNEQVTALRRAVSDVSGETTALRRDLDTRLEELSNTLRRDLDGGLARAVASAQAMDAGLASTLRGELAADRLRIDAAIDGLRLQLPRLVDAGIASARRELLTIVSSGIAIAPITRPR